MGDLLSFSVGRRLAAKRGTPATAWYDRGCAVEATDLAEAIRCYERALAGRPDLADAHNNLGRVLHERAPSTTGADLAAAECHYRLAICLDPDVALYWFNLGVAIEDRGCRAEAIEAYDRALALDPHLADAHYNLARLYEAAGRRSGDELMIRRAVRHLLRYRDTAPLRNAR